MKWDKDTIILAINIMITIVSSFGAYKSFRYFKKSKHITIYANTSQALNELGEMLKMLPEAFFQVLQAHAYKTFTVQESRVCECRIR